MPDEKLKRALDFLKTVNEGLTREDFNRAFKIVLDSVVALERKLIQKNANLAASEQASLNEALATLRNARKELEQYLKQARSETASSLTNIRQRALEAVQGIFTKMNIQSQFDALTEQASERLQAADEAIAQAKAIAAPTPQSIRDSLQKLEGDDRLDKSAIKGLDEELKSIRASGGTSFVISRGAVKAYDLSDSLDGSTKTFALPAFWRVISVHLSSFPNILRPTTDYTTDASVPSITFTSQIDAASTLSAGQTLLIVYAEP